MNHIGMATDEEKTGTYREFTRNILPMIAASGYNTVQLMAIQEHPFYGSFGYHVSNFFAASSRFGTPDDLKELIDTAHGYGLRVIMDLVHSHCVKNVNEGLGLFDGSLTSIFIPGTEEIILRGIHFVSIMATTKFFISFSQIAGIGWRSSGLTVSGLTVLRV